MSMTKCMRVNHDKTGEADEMNQDVDSKDKVMHV